MEAVSTSVQYRLSYITDSDSIQTTATDTITYTVPLTLSKITEWAFSVAGQTA